MKNLPVDNFGFLEIGGVGEMVYKAVRFPGYQLDNDEHGEFLKPVFLPVPGKYNPKYGTDYGLTGQELLAELCNLYRRLNNPKCETQISYGIYKWCRENVHPYNMDALVESLEAMYSGDVESLGMYENIAHDAEFYIDTFKKDLCELGTVFEYDFALEQVRAGNITAGRELYYEGRMCDSLPFLEKYRNCSDEEYRQKVNEDYRYLKGCVLDMMPDFRMRLKQDKKKGTIMFGADTQSIFDICWYSFARMIADVAPSADEDLNYMQSTGSILYCMSCGDYFVRHSSRQLYCSKPNCQAERNKRKSRAYYNRKKNGGHDNG
ncbi:MAG: hypothetical protein LUF68_09050 [Clostridiales bacterium]|nr:hypothetical protein [Clostridiales bacterium]